MLRIMQERTQHETKPTIFVYFFSWISASGCLHSPPTYHHALSKKTNLVFAQMILVRTWPLLLLSSLDQKSRSHGHFVEKSFPLIILRTVFHSGFIFHMFIGVGADMTPFDIEFVRSKVEVIMMDYVK